MSELSEVKTQDLSGAALDWAVAKAEGVAVNIKSSTHPVGSPLRGARYLAIGDMGIAFNPSADWRQGGNLIVSRGVSLRCIAPLNAWKADCWDDSVVPSRYCQAEAETPLVAACRAIAASVHGDTVSVPKELLS